MFFVRESRQGFKTLFWIGLSIVLILSDHNGQHLSALRSRLGAVFYPLQWIVDFPARWVPNLGEYFSTQQRLLRDNALLRETQFYQNGQLQKLLALEAENSRLRNLLQSSSRVGEKFIAAEIIQVDSDPFRHRMIINRGATSQVHIGQPMIDAAGVMGEVIEVYENTSRIILITDASHGLPIENVRNGIRAIAFGTGMMGRLEVRHIPSTVDLKVGDTWVTSGLGGKFPAGYPVGIIQSITEGAGDAFATIWVTPSAHLERSRHVLLIYE
jgi:rod shape-determining protein MreC